ncbi:Cell division coordinator CpoB [Sinobacterium norvegicum]|uniref:Cell division coordinator CpoB n=1 Tax=Sinobacterium norvegicum TaxID=1641715 RepID=A0ABM9AEM5_9GAMM|nr:tol-pal system protein YbgF [Sinobacterium norvegicum]CAH0991652.1 Cell division coordinator CpoB [Sinobacterium norvegicum]
MKNSMTAIISAFAGGVLLHSPFAIGQIEIVDATATKPIEQPVLAAPISQNQGGAELFNQLQMLQQEVMQLRGIVEEQSHTIRQLQQQRKDDYLSIDRRLTAIQGGATAVSPATAVVPASGQSAGAGEKAAYDEAYGLIRQQKIEQATTAFDAFLVAYPNGKYTPNAYYWAAELSLLKPDSEKARQLFEQLISQYPNDRKAPDAMFKLGKTYYQLGDKAKAKTLMEDIVGKYQGQSLPTSKMAEDFLRQHY